MILIWLSEDKPFLLAKYFLSTVSQGPTATKSQTLNTHKQKASCNLNITSGSACNLQSCGQNPPQSCPI